MEPDTTSSSKDASSSSSADSSPDASSSPSAGSSANAVDSTVWFRPRSARRFALVDRQLTVSFFTSAVVVAGVLGFWLLGKLSWNHDPLVSQSFAAASFDALTNRPQSTALELHHALSVGNFAYAKSLVGPNANHVVTRAEDLCASSCPKPEQSRGKVFTRATLLENNIRDAVVRAESFDDHDTLLRSATYEVAREGDRWLVVGLRAE